MEVLTTLLVFLAVIIGAAGVVFSSEATLGVALVALACLLAIFGRIAQAAHHHNSRKN